MKIDWDKIKVEIISETKEILEKEQKFNIQEVIDLFFNVLKFPVNADELTGISIRIPNALQKIFIESISRIDKNSFFPDVASIEPFLRKILYLIDKESYSEIVEKKEGLNSLINHLGLNSKNINLNWTSLYSNQRINFGEQLLKAYQLRNIESHNCKEWNNVRLYDELRNVLAIYLYSVHLHFNSLKLIIEPNDLTEYLLKQLQLFKVWQSRFVHLEGKEEFSEVELYAKEIFDQTEEEENDEDFEDIKIAREGRIDDLRKKVIEKQMVILGEVGMGKSTTLQYLFFKDAQYALQNKNAQIPIYFELKNLTEKDDLLLKIIEKIGKDKDFALKMIKEGRLNIFLDGLNEIEKNIKSKIFVQIKNLLSEFSKNFYIITSRPQGYNREFDELLQNRKVPVFVLQKMQDNQISEFLDKNGKNVKAYIQTEINANERLKKIVQTPLMLIMLIAVVQKLGKIPNEKGKIIRAFIFSLYEREQKQIIDFDKDVFHLLLCYLGYHTRDLTGSNSGLDRDEYILPMLEERRLQLGTPVNLLDFLRKAADLNVLVKEGNQYSFTHELYQEYYAAEYLHQYNKA
jgi:predicted NACHT family NTPase